MTIDPPSRKRHPNSIVFHDADWGLYRAMLRRYDELPSRINYDRGVMEVMTLSLEHESYKSVLGVMIGQLSMASGIPAKNAGSTTLKRKKFQRGLEADLCYWIQQEEAMRTKKRIDLRTDPPPDLVIEIDVMHAVVNRESIYAKLGVQEMWVLRHAKLYAFRLVTGQWQPIERSIAFPFLKVIDLNPFVARIGHDSDMDLLNDFAQWLRQFQP